MPVHIRGLRELNRAFAIADKEMQAYTRTQFREVAEPIRSEAASLALSGIRNMSRSTAWAGMRTGVVRSLVYVAPAKRGTKRVSRGGNVRMQRPNLADLLAERAMEPALEQHEHDVERRVDEALDRMATKFNGGI